MNNPENLKAFIGIFKFNHSHLRVCSFELQSEDIIACLFARGLTPEQKSHINTLSFNQECCFQYIDKGFGFIEIIGDFQEMWPSP